MKSLLLIPSITTGFCALFAAVLLACGVRVNPLDPLTAAIACSAAGVIGIFPMLAAKRKDAVGIFQLALVGTVLHLLSAIGLIGAAFAAHIVSARMGFVYWALAGYWISLITLLWQLRRLLFTAFGLTKVQQS